MTPNEFKKKLTPENLKIYNELDTNLQLTYATDKCILCDHEIAIGRINTNVKKGVPPICRECAKQYKNKLNNMAELLGQLNLF